MNTLCALVVWCRLQLARVVREEKCVLHSDKGSKRTIELEQRGSIEYKRRWWTDARTCLRCGDGSAQQLTYQNHLFWRINSILELISPC